jgi:hypothetical protein
MIGPETRKKQRAALEALARTITNALRACDLHESGYHASGFEDCLKRAVKACQNFLADPSMADFLPSSTKNMTVANESPAERDDREAGEFMARRVGAK